jgi:glycosyltransferase involved in cell wall biosynthesis
MKAAGLVSVVIPAYNAERYLGEAIESVLEQTHRQVEIVVVDDGSEDGTLAVAGAYGDRIRLASQANGGIGSARNHAAGLARGSYLSFLDADDRFLRDKLERQLAALAHDSELDMVFGHVREFVSPELAPEEQAALRPSPPAPFVAPNTMLIRRESFDRVGPFATDVRVGEGVDWYARATEAGLKGLTLPDIVLERRLHDSNTGIRERDSRSDYLQVVRSALQRRRQAAG